MDDRQEPLPSRVGGIGHHLRFSLAADGSQLLSCQLQVTRLEEGIHLVYGDHDRGPLVWGDQRAHLRQAGDQGQGAGDDPHGPVGELGDVVVAVQGGEVAGDVGKVIEGAALPSEPAVPYGQPPLVLGTEITAQVTGDLGGGPGVHGHVVPCCEQGEVGKALHIGG